MFPFIIADVLSFPFPPPNTFPIIEIAFAFEVLSLILIFTLLLIVPSELPPYTFPYIFRFLLWSFIFIKTLPFTLVDDPSPPPNNASVL